MKWKQVEEVGLFHNDANENGETLVLHVDDDPQFGNMVSLYLEKIRDNLTVVTETDAGSGLDRVENDPIDCIISDYQMPKMDGLEFLEAVRDEYPNLPFILFTGEGSERIASEATTHNVTSYLQKSGTETYELLAQQVENAVNHHRSKRLAKVTEDRLFGLYEQADGFYMLDENWTITYWNPRISERTGRDPEDVLGRSYWNVFPEAKELKTEPHFREAMETRNPVKFEVWYEPCEYWADVRAYPIDRGLFVHSRNISDIKEQEREIERRNHILESFANTVSHDLRNPLQVAEGRLQLAEKTGDFEHLNEVKQAHNRMRNLIDNLLSIARGEDLDISEISLQESASEAWSTVTSKETKLEIDDSARFEAQPSQLRRLFENLFWNALEHGDADVVRVGVMDDDGIYIEDDGQGIPTSERDRIFDTGYSTTEDGPGYGLHIVESIADLHDWTIRVTEGDTGGARFEIRGITFVDQ
ncbi:hybrid sensor histidine kinase/response regulator [Halorubrum aethiopicum]|uniref:hybrid sensor histidine kinase/response regulator n=1 Tax=Halorubrum aethiopicum TaxID=1758255 RepID=UPI0009B5BFD3|nr:response regulator [Halorubrum aethiopicum]